MLAQNLAVHFALITNTTKRISIQSMYALRATLKRANTTKTPRAMWRQRTLLNGLPIVTPITVQYVKCSLKRWNVGRKRKTSIGRGRPAKKANNVESINTTSKIDSSIIPEALVENVPDSSRFIEPNQDLFYPICREVNITRCIVKHFLFLVDIII